MGNCSSADSGETIAGRQSHIDSLDRCCASDAASESRYIESFPELDCIINPDEQLPAPEQHIHQHQLQQHQHVLHDLLTSALEGFPRAVVQSARYPTSDLLMEDHGLSKPRGP